MNNFWYIELDGVIVPTPYQSYHQAEAARREMVSKMIAVISRVVMLDDEGNPH